MFEKLEQKAKTFSGGDDGQTAIVDESIQRSLFGYFSMNYNRYNKERIAGNKDTLEIWKNIFSMTKILKQDVYRSLLYFNLPYAEIIAQNKIKPELLYSNYDLGTLNKNDNKSENPMIQMLEKFDKRRELEPRETRLANLILMEISNKSLDSQAAANKGGGQNHRQDEESSYIIGGFASDAWSSKAEWQSKGDDTCFLFNLTLDLRFKA